ncbi:MAG: DUF5668 domain-containing protein [candidate division Zixibacteria bacterium]
MKRDYSGLLWGLAFIVVGALMILDRLEIVYFNFGHFISNWWPLALVIVGVSMVLKNRSCCGSSEKAGE